MQINSVNSPAFGCGACAAAYKKAERLAEIPGTTEFFARLEKENVRKIVKTDIDTIQILKKAVHGHYNHGQIASQYNSELGQRIKDLA